MDKYNTGKEWDPYRVCATPFKKVYTCWSVKCRVLGKEWEGCSSYDCNPKMFISPLVYGGNIGTQQYRIRRVRYLFIKDPIHTAAFYEHSPAFSTPCRVWSDDHLPAVVCVRVVHIQLQRLSFMSLNKGKQIFWLKSNECIVTVHLLLRFKIIKMKIVSTSNRQRLIQRERNTQNLTSCP